MPVLKSSLVAGMSAVVVATASGAVTPQVTHTNVPAVYAAPAQVSTYAEKYYLTASPLDLLGLPFQDALALGRVVVAALHLQDERARLLLADARLAAEQAH